MIYERRQYVYLLVAIIGLVGTLTATAIVSAREENFHHINYLHSTSTKTSEPTTLNISQISEATQPSPLLEALGAEVYARLQAGELPWDLDLQLTPEEWEAWYHLDKVVEPSILLDAYGSVVYAQLQAGHYPTDLGLSFTSKHWNAWYMLDRMSDEDLPLCPPNDVSPENLLRHKIIPRSEGDSRPICLSVPEIVIDHTQAISDVLSQGGTIGDIGLSEDPRIVRPDLYK